MTDEHRPRDTRPAPYPIRMPAELRAAMVKLAKQHRRSLAQEILLALELYVAEHNRPESG